jgi:FAD/FMN-containing dehydrogenase
LFPAELHLKKMCAVLWCVLGEAQDAAKAVSAFRDLKTPALDYTGEIPFSSLQSMFDALYPQGLQWYWKADFVKELSDEAIKLNVRYAEKLPTPHSTMHLYPINGAVHETAESDTAFAYRDVNWAQVIVGVDPDREKRDVISTWAREYWQALHPFSAGGAYVNFMMDEGVDRIRASYRGNYERLSRIKARYDPENLFSVNQNIKPHSI